MDNYANRKTRVAIGVATFMRPIGLARLLESIRCLKLPSNQDVALQVIVVDNDPEGSAKTIVREASQSLNWPVNYSVEPRRGISFARNRIVSLAMGCDFLAFVDDDEYVTQDWLCNLLAAQDRFAADIVGGSVTPEFSESVPGWIVDGKFFDPITFPTGTRLGPGSTSTSNVLLKLSILGVNSEPFDERFALSGGEDTLLFMQLLRRGALIVSCDEARVIETVPGTRASFRWLVKGAYRDGTSYALCERIAYPGVRTILLRLFKGKVRILVGLLLLLAVPVRGKVYFVKTLLSISKGVGMLAGVFGHRYDEYREIHGE